MSVTSDLGPEKALIFRIVHRRNMPWLIANGLHCESSSTRDPNYLSIGSPELIARRSIRKVPIPPGGTLGDYIPFYFTPLSPMLFNIKTGIGVQKREMSDIVIVVASLVDLKKQGVDLLFTDRHAYLQAARFFSDPRDLTAVDWKILQSCDFCRSAEDPGKIERYQAEALIFGSLPMRFVKGFVCYTQCVKVKLEEMLARHDLHHKVADFPGWFFS